jgi:site-specific recombinase XerD
LQTTGDTQRTYVFISQRSERLTEEAIHYWFRTLKEQATRNQWEEIEALTFQDLRHDFAQRAREAGWSLEELASYLGYGTGKSLSALQTTVHHTQLTQEQIKHKLENIKG